MNRRDFKASPEDAKRIAEAPDGSMVPITPLVWRNSDEPDVFIGLPDDDPYGTRNMPRDDMGLPILDPADLGYSPDSPIYKLVKGEE